MTDSARYPIPARAHAVDRTVRRSRFITALAHAPDAHAAHAFVDAVRQRHPGATHHCFAFVAGPPGSTTHIGMSDDGEPHGTAGRPMLTVLLHGGVGEIVAVCTRYFGGVKLGTGGLARAYSGGVRLALESLPTEEKVERVAVGLEVDYRFVDAVQRLVAEMHARVAEEEYGERARFRLLVAVTDVGRLEAALADLTGGEATLTT